jgi:hypothetical protein
MVRFAMAAVVLAFMGQAVQAEEGVEQVEIFSAVDWPWADKDGKKEIEKINEKLLEIQKQNSITRVTFTGTANNHSSYYLVVFYKPGKPKQAEQILVLDGVRSAKQKHREGQTGQDWINDQLKKLQKDHVVTRAELSSAGQHGNSDVLLVFYAKK